ncbi:hypothetical protein [Cerasicoccus frondis]|uniref:hypothetical protein n=1 Tax=Cerasicoccus frondis TaxID=490090 RepID=UPI00285249E3|nr:hypothetical protein [Cerasicoccus frondis]
MSSRVPYIIVFVTIGILGAFQALPNDLLAITVFVATFWSFYRGLDTHIPILEITACIATLQWLIGPVLGYAFGSSDPRYEMYIEAGRYYAFALPGTCFYLAALYVFPSETKQREFLATLSDNRLYYRGLALLGISLVSELALRVGVGGLTFAFVLLSQLRYIAAIYFLYSGHPMRYYLAGLSMVSLLIRSAESAMFHDLIIWVGLVACFWFHTVRWNPPKKALFFIAGFSFIFTLQVIKADYRSKVWNHQSASLVATVYDKLVRQQAFLDEPTLIAAGQRINQGWIISAIMLHVPLVEPYAEGETIKDAVISSIFPRVIYADKKRAGGQENFERFTGLNLESGTSMGTSILGEAYANFGKFGGTVFMFLWGLIYAFFYRLAIRHSYKDAYFLFWIPLIFYQAIKAETELVVVLNQLIKGTVLALIAFFGVHKYIVPDTESPTNDDTDFPEEDTGSLPEAN